MFAAETRDAVIYIEMDVEGNISMAPHTPDYGLVLDGDFIYIRLPMEVDAEDVSLSLPEGWTYEFEHEEEEGTVIRVTHTWNHGGYASFEPFVSGALFPVHDLVANASLQQWNTAIGTSGNRVIRVMGDQASMPSTITIGNGRGLTGFTFRGGVQVTGASRFNMENGAEIHNARTNHGGAILASGGSTIRLSGGAIHGNFTVPGSAGGVAVTGTGNRTLPENLNIERNRAQNGGGMAVMMDAGTNNRLTISEGVIRNNHAFADGGGLFIPHENLDNLNIAEAVAFSGNVAGNGIRIDNALAIKHRPHIDPQTVSITDVGGLLLNAGNIVEITPHAFTNYDINTTAQRLWRVTYEAEAGLGSVVAKVDGSEVLIPSGILVPDNTTISFAAQPALRFERWDIGTRANETDEDGKEVGFNYSDGGINTPLLHTVEMHTHVIGYFGEMPSSSLTVSKEVTGDFGNRSLEFEFTILCQDSNGDPLPLGTQFHCYSYLP